MHVYSNVEILFGWFQIFKKITTIRKTADVMVGKWPLYCVLRHKQQNRILWEMYPYRHNNQRMDK